MVAMTRSLNLAYPIISTDPFYALKPGNGMSITIVLNSKTYLVLLTLMVFSGTLMAEAEPVDATKIYTFAG